MKVVYIHKRRDNGEVFYVGMGNRDRAYTDKGRNYLWKYVSKVYGINVEIVKDGLTKEEALKLESQLIDEYGRTEITNLIGGSKGDLKNNESKYISEFNLNKNRIEKDDIENIFIKKTKPTLVFVVRQIDDGTYKYLSQMSIFANPNSLVSLYKTVINTYKSEQKKSILQLETYKNTKWVKKALINDQEGVVICL